MNLATKIRLSAVMAGYLALGAYLLDRGIESWMGVLGDIQKPYSLPVPVAYSADHITINVSPGNTAYIRYERTGFDGAKYCMQELDMPGVKLIDGISNSCDNVIDTLVATRSYAEGEYDPVILCEDDKHSGRVCKANEEAFQDFISNPVTVKILDYWYGHRQGCKEKECYARIDFKFK